MTDLSLGYCGRLPTTRVERFQVRIEAELESVDDDTIRAYFDVGSDPVPEAAEADTEEEN